MKLWCAGEGEVGRQVRSQAVWLRLVRGLLPALLQPLQLRHKEVSDLKFLLGNLQALHFPLDHLF